MYMASPQPLTLAAVMATLAPPPFAHAGAARKPKAPVVKPSPMHASWHLKDPKTWSFPQRMFVRTGMLPQPAGKPLPPKHDATDKVPFLPVWRQWAWLMPRAVAPLLLHAVYVEWTGRTLHPIAAYCG